MRVMILQNLRKKSRDKVLCSIKAEIRKSCAVGHEIVNVGAMHEMHACGTRMRTVCKRNKSRAAVSTLHESCKNFEVHKINQFSELHNFRYE